MVFTKSSKRLSAVANDGPPAKRQDLVPSPTKLGGASASSRRANRAYSTNKKTAVARSLTWAKKVEESFADLFSNKKGNVPKQLVRVEIVKACSQLEVKMRPKTKQKLKAKEYNRAKLEEKMPRTLFQGCAPK